MGGSRCPWAGTDSLYIAYHDREWGVPLHDDQGLFEFLVLEGAQAGLSWLTILRKREHFRKAFAGFDPERVARFGEEEMQRLLADKGIIRNAAKIRSAVRNARAFLAVRDHFGSFDAYIWGFMAGEPLVNHWASMDRVPAATDLSRRISRDMKQRGFTFFGPTICYAFMQAVGMVNDHLVSCFRHREIEALGRAAAPGPGA